MGPIDNLAEQMQRQMADAAERKKQQEMREVREALIDCVDSALAEFYIDEDRRVIAAVAVDAIDEFIRTKAPQ